MPARMRGGAPKLLRILLPLYCFAIFGCGHKSGSTRGNQTRLMEGVGAIHHRIATANPEAQKFFDQGLALVYGFNFGDAIHSFQRASELDPNAAMPYWGLALAHAPNYNAWMVSRDAERAGFDAIQTAVGLAPKAPEQERLYIDALARSFTDQPKPDQARLAHDYSDAMRDVYRRSTDDPDAAALFAASLMNLNPWHLWTLDGAPGADTAEIVGVLEESLRRWPDHIGLNHFYIHTMEGSKYPERALASAQRLETLAPGASHLVHMSSHIYFRTGDYAGAVRSNQRATRIPGAMGYSNHNQYFLAVAAGMDGEFEIARSAAAQLQAHVHNEAMTAMSTVVPLRFARWDEILAMPAPNANLKGVTFLWRLARGCAYAAKHRFAEAIGEQAAMEEAFARLPQGRAFGSFFNDWGTLHELAADTLSARIAAARGDTGAAIASWRDAVRIQDGMNFDDVPDWYYPVRESLGAALLGNRQAAEAEQVFRDDLARNPRNPRSLFGLATALAQQQKSYQAELVRQTFQAAWKGAEAPRIEDF